MKGEISMEFPIRIHIGSWVESFVIWLTDNFSVFFDGITRIIGFILIQIDNFFNWVPWPVTIGVMVLLAWRISGVKVALFTGIALFIMGTLGLWSEGMSTLALMTTAVFISVLLGLPLGIFAAKSDTFNAFLQPILDGMQTIPSFVYLIPAIMLFGIGNVPGIFATVVFALPPMVRLTSLGIRQVNVEVVEAGNAFGATPWQLLIKIQLPLALPSIMAGINQTVMMALAMVVVAAMIGAGGIGAKILYSIQRIDLATGVEAGLVILFLAMILDRIIQGVTKRQQKMLLRQH
jgi:glycine betaine/proline transport system permease protein